MGVRSVNGIMIANFQNPLKSFDMDGVLVKYLPEILENL